MRYFVQVDEREYQVEIGPEQVSIDGEVVEVEWAQSGVPELFSLLLDGASYEVVIHPQRNQYAVTLHGLQFRVQVEDEATRRLRAGRAGPTVPDGDIPVKAPIPGLVVKVLVGPGDEVVEGQPLVILEAMKMENELRAPRQGTVKSVETVAGHRVEQNSVLLTLT